MENNNFMKKFEGFIQEIIKVILEMDKRISELKLL